MITGILGSHPLFPRVTLHSHLYAAENFEIASHRALIAAIGSNACLLSRKRSPSVITCSLARIAGKREYREL